MQVSTGDKVRCIDASGHGQGTGAVYLEVGKIYRVVSRADSDQLTLEGIRLNWKRERFVPTRMSNEERMEERRKQLCSS